MMKALVCSPIGDVTGIDLPLWMLKYVFLGSYIIMLLYVLTYQMKTTSKLLILGFASFLCGYLLSMYYIPAVAGLAFYFLYPHFNKGSYILSFAALALTIVSYCLLPELPFPMNGVLTSIFIVLMVMYNPMLQKILEMRIFKWLGKVSFMLYLIHMPIICSLSCWLCVNLPSDELLAKTLPIYIITLLISLFLAHIFTYWIEDKLSKTVISRLMKKLPKIDG